MPRKAPMIMQLEDELFQARVAREEFIRNYCQHLPPTYAAMIPLTDEAATLIEWKRHLEQTFAEDMEANNSPWARTGDGKTRAINWDGVPAKDRMWLSSSGVEVAPGVPLVRFGKGVDPSDGVRKPFEEFAEVIAARDTASKRPEVQELIRLRVEYRDLVGKLSMSSNHRFESREAADAARARHEQLSEQIKQLEATIRNS